MAIPALAKGHHHDDAGTTIKNTSGAWANTGNNTQDMTSVVTEAHEVVAVNAELGKSSRSIHTDEATARSEAVVIADVQVGCSDCAEAGSQGHHEEDSLKLKITNTSDAEADTGNNAQDVYTGVSKAHEVVAGNLEMGGSSRSIHTDEAKATSKAWTVTGVKVFGLED